MKPNRAQTRAALSLHRRKKLGWTWEKREPNDQLVADHGQVAKNVAVAWVNGFYIVLVYAVESEWGEVIQLSIRKVEGGPCESWEDCQRIKNEIVGIERVAIQVYPHVDDVVNDAPMTHLWVLPKSWKLPFGLHLPTAWGGA